MELKPGYQQTEAGIIPEDWDVRSLESIAVVTSGKRLPLGCSLTERVTPHPYIRITDMRPGTVSLNEIRFVPVDVFPAIKNYRIYKEDIFISVAGTLGIVGKIPPALDGANLTENANRISNINCSRDYLLNVLSSPLIQNTITSIQTVGAQPKLALIRIRMFSIPLPPTRAEQDAIAEALGDADALIKSLEQLLAKKRQLKRGAMQDLLTGKKRLPGFAGEWDVVQLHHLLRSGPQNGYSGLTSDEATGTATLSLAATSNGRLTLNTKTIKHLAYRIPENSPLFLEAGDVLVQRSNTAELVGTTAIFYGPASTYIYPDLMMRLRFKQPVTGVWYWWYANSARGRAFFRGIAAGSTGSMPKISGAALRNMPVPLPTLGEQEAITSVLSDIDADITMLERKISKARSFKQAMVNELLTGRIRLV